MTMNPDVLALVPTARQPVLPADRSVASHALRARRRPIAASNKATLVATVMLGAVGLYAGALWTAHVPGLEPAVLGAIFLASMLSSVGGFAFSAICGALLVHLMSGQVHMVELMIVCSIAIQSLSVWSLRHAVNWQALPAFLVGGVVSLPLGVYLLLHIPHKAFAAVVGLFLIAYGGFMLFRRPMQLQRDYGRRGDVLAGLLGGITGGFAGFPGALITIWCSLKGWDKRQQRGVYQPFILIMQVLTLVVLHVMHHSVGDAMDPVALTYVPAALMGTWCGLRLYEFLSDRQFAMALNLLMVVSGAGLFAG
jgi:uncharacterized membrane protein YfcA